MSENVLTQGVHHVGLTVSNLELSQSFFQTLLGYNVVGEKADYPAVFLSDGKTMITLWQAKGSDVVGFDRHSNIGLHHLAIAVTDKDSLNTLYQHLSSDDNTTIEFAPEPLGQSGAFHMMCFIPGGPRVEFIAG